MKKVKLVMTLRIEVLETLHGLISGCLGTSGDDDFNYEIAPIERKLRNKINKFYKNKKIT